MSLLHRILLQKLITNPKGLRSKKEHHRATITRPESALLEEDFIKEFIF
jgi:hypothetical protein